MNPWRESLGCEVNLCSARLCSREFMKRCSLRREYQKRIEWLKLKAKRMRHNSKAYISIIEEIKRLQGDK